MANIITRSDYLSAQGDRKAAYRAYYAQFVTPAHFARIERGIGIQAVKASTDEHFNDIPLKLWDKLAVPVPAESARLMKEALDYPTLCGAVCILKEAAQQIREQAAVAV